MVPFIIASSNVYLNSVCKNLTGLSHEMDLAFYDMYGKF
jgi:hypothetical protein